MSTNTLAHRAKPFGRFWERRGTDFPYYNGQPVAVAGWRWAALLVSVAVAIVMLLNWRPEDNWAAVIPRVLFLAIQLGALIVLLPTGWTALFRRVSWWDLGVVAIFAALCAVVTLIGVAIWTGTGHHVTGDSAEEGIKRGGTSGAIGFLLGSIFQLMGEELFAIIPFLAILWFLFRVCKWDRRWSVVVALLVSSLIFAIAHLSAYDGHLAQILLTILPARIILTLAYIRTKNIWVSFAVHLIWDWSGFLQVFGDATTSLL